MVLLLLVPDPNITTPELLEFAEELVFEPLTVQYFIMLFVEPPVNRMAYLEELFWVFSIVSKLVLPVDPTLPSMVILSPAVKSNTVAPLDAVIVIVETMEEFGLIMIEPATLVVKVIGLDSELA